MEKNKTRLIRPLTEHMEEVGIIVKQSSADADALIVRTAIGLSYDQDVVVVGTDVDLLILLIQLSEPDSHVYFFRTWKWKTAWQNFQY